MATPFDEPSVDLCVQFDFPIIKVASSDLNDWPLLEKVASTRRPVIVSSGGASEKDLDDLVSFFEKRNIPLSINHCVSLYPSEDDQLELNQIDYLRLRYPEHVIGFSTHEFRDWHSSMLISYGKGARTWERHIDIRHGDKEVAPYCSLPEQIDEWFKAFQKAREMCGGSGGGKRVIGRREIEYLDALVRGVYARRDLEADYVFTRETFAEDFYLAVPLQEGPAVLPRDHERGATGARHRGGRGVDHQPYRGAVQRESGFALADSQSRSVARPAAVPLWIHLRART